ncbi:hypothetical protein ASB62_04890 [Chlorobium limicola]|uniref:Uncharacterized protein n=1 Tax=Chlorobium limicola TaxID=1092 RepID=A0A101JP62_CHLLI|nr:hypothetical protein ASB62_04890 [Chlorobium limicola]
MKILVPVCTFLVGLYVQIASVDKIVSLVRNEWRLFLHLFIILLIMQALVIIVLSIFLSEVHAGRKDMTDLLDSAVRQSGLKAEFVEEDDGDNAGKTYEITRNLIEKAQHSLLFVDFWVKSNNYHAKKPTVQKRRQDYYDSIISQLKKHQDHDGDQPFHVRMIQKPDQLEADLVYSGHLKECCEIQENCKTVSVVKIAPPCIHAHFAIIDERYVIWPILSSGPDGSGLRRHGALIFDDPNKYLVNRLKAIYTMLDKVAQAYQPNTISIPAKSN